MNSEVIYQNILSDRNTYPFDNYPERLAYIRSATGPVGTLEEEYRKPLITLITGGANVGKSRLFNLLVGKDISPVKDISGYTRDFFIAADPKVDLKVMEHVSPDSAKIHQISQGWINGKILVDTPDFDSINDYNRKRLEEVVPLAHVVVVLVTAAKREIAPLTEILLRYAGRKTFLFVMNKQDREENYKQEFITFLKKCGFPNPMVIRSSCALPASANPEEKPVKDTEWLEGVNKIRAEIGRVDHKRAKTHKYQADVRDGIELLYNPTRVCNTLKLLEEKKQDFDGEVKKFLQSEVSSTISSLAHHPRVIRDVVLMELARRRKHILGFLLRIWAQYRFFLGLAGAGSFFSRASGSAIPFYSGVISGLLTQAGQATSLNSLRDQVRRGLDENSSLDFLRNKYLVMKELLSRCRIRKDLHPPDDFSSLAEEHKQYLEKAVENFLAGLIQKKYGRVLVFLEFLAWMGTAAYGVFRARLLYQQNQMTPESMVLAIGACFLLLSLVLLTGFIFYVGGSIRKKLKKIDTTDLPEDITFTQPLQPAIEGLKYFEKSVEDALQSIGSTPV